MATYISILVVIAIATVWFAIALPPLTVIYVIIQRWVEGAACHAQSPSLAPLLLRR